MRVTSPIGTRLEPGRIPLLEEQVVTLNRELTREVLRHAETRVQLKTARSWIRIKQELEADSEREEA